MNMLYEGLKQNSTIVVVPSTAVESMQLGSIAGLTALTMGRQKGSRIFSIRRARVASVSLSCPIVVEQKEYLPCMVLASAARHSVGGEDNLSRSVRRGQDFSIAKWCRCGKTRRGWGSRREGSHRVMISATFLLLGLTRITFSPSLA